MAKNDKNDNKKSEPKKAAPPTPPPRPTAAAPPRVAGGQPVVITGKPAKPATNKGTTLTSAGALKTSKPQPKLNNTSRDKPKNKLVQAEAGTGLMGFMNAASAAKSGRKVPELAGAKFGKGAIEPLGIKMNGRKEPKGTILAAVPKGYGGAGTKASAVKQTQPAKPIPRPLNTGGTMVGGQRPVPPVDPTTGLPATVVPNTTPPRVATPVQGAMGKPTNWNQNQKSGGGGNKAQGGNQGSRKPNAGAMTGTAGAADKKRGEGRYRFT